MFFNVVYDYICMLDPIFFEIHKDLPREGPGRNQYTQKAYKMLPKMERPSILDIGCGPGQQTIELAQQSNGSITAIDIHQPYLDVLDMKIKEQHLQDHVVTVNQSMFSMDFPEESFDIIWAEGSIFVIGFKRGLREWKKIIKSKGYLIVHEMSWLHLNPPEEIKRYWENLYAITTIEHNLEMIHDGGYILVDYFTLPEDAWWEPYYTPLEER